MLLTLLNSLCNLYAGNVRLKLLKSNLNVLTFQWAEASSDLTSMLHSFSCCVNFVIIWCYWDTGLALCMLHSVVMYGLLFRYFIICPCFTCSEMANGETSQEKVDKKPVKKKSKNNKQSTRKTKRIYCILCRKYYMNHVSGLNSSAE